VYAPAHIAGTVDPIMAGQQAETDQAAGQAILARVEDATGKMARYGRMAWPIAQFFPVLSVVFVASELARSLSASWEGSAV
jgi:hypothetical protein